MRSSLQLLGAFVFAAGCGGGADCLALPCALPLAINAKVVDKATGAALKVHVEVTGGMTGSLDCDSVCFIPGVAGVYHLAVTAAGYASSTTDVTVADAKPTSACGCEQINAQTITISLARIS